MAGLLQVSQTATKNTGTPGATPDDFVDNRETIVQAVGVYYGGKITDNSGALIQYNWDGVEQKWAVEMVDVRAGDSVTIADKELVWGVTTNNNPTLSDIYTSTPNWAFPHIQSLTLMPAASTMIASGLVSQVGGVGAYGLWDNLVYAEFDGYHTANTGFFRPMAAGVTVDNIVSGTAPYWRVALQRESGPHSFEIGTYGMVTNVFADPEDQSLGTNRFKDYAFDGQYQYLEGDQSISLHVNWIHENQQWNTSFPQGLTSNPSDTLKQFYVDLHYAYQRRYAGVLQYFATTGNADT